MRFSGLEWEAMARASDKAYRATPSSHHLTIFISFLFHLSRSILFWITVESSWVECCDRNLTIGVAPPLTQYDASRFRIRCSLYRLRATAVSPRRLYWSSSCQWLLMNSTSVMLIAVGKLEHCQGSRVMGDPFTAIQRQWHRLYACT